MIKLTNEEKKLVEELVEINKNLYSLYEKLCNLELEKTLNSLEYKKIIGYIKMVKEELELEVYNKIVNLNPQKKSEIILHLKSIKNKTNLDILKSILRISNSFLYQNRHQSNFKILNDTFDKLCKNQNLNKELIEGLNESIYICGEFHKMLELDIDNLTLYLLEEEIKKENNNYASLIKIKYDLLFTKKELEDEIISNDLKSYSFPKIFVFGQMYNLNPNFIKLITDQYLSSILHETIKYILDTNISDKLLNYKKIYIRSLFLLMSKEELENENYLFNELIENKEYLMNHPDNTKKEEIIKKLFRNIDQDKRKILTINKNI